MAHATSTRRKLLPSTVFQVDLNREGFASMDDDDADYMQGSEDEVDISV